MENRISLLRWSTYLRPVFPSSPLKAVVGRPQKEGCHDNAVQHRALCSSNELLSVASANRLLFAVDQAQTQGSITVAFFHVPTVE